LEITNPGDLFATDTDNIGGLVVVYELLLDDADLSGKYNLQTYDDNSVKISLANPPSTYDSFTDVLKIKVSLTEDPNRTLQT